MIAYRVNIPARLLVLHFSGNAPFDNWRAMADRAMAEAPDIHSFNSIVDLRSLKETPTADALRAHAHNLKQLGLHDTPRKQVILAGSNVQFGLSRMFEMQTESERKTQYMTTYSVAGAAAWLGLPESLVQAELDAASAAKIDDRADGASSSLP